MGRWTQYDEDSYRLPQGMQRVGYDADTGRYYYKDGAGSMWQGPQGSQFGELTRVSGTPSVDVDTHDEDDDLEAAGRRTDGYQPLATDAGAQHVHRSVNSQAYRTLFPFFMMIIVALLLVWRLARPLHHHDGKPEVSFCSELTLPYRVAAGDTCWDISQSHGFSLKQLMEANRGLNCDLLTPGEIICLPEGKQADQRRKNIK